MARAPVPLAYLAILGAAARRSRDGIGPSRATRELLETLADASQITTYTTPAVDPTTLMDTVDTAGAAEILSVSTRRVQQLADEIGCHRHGRALVFDRGAVLAYHAQRQEEPS